MHTQKLTFCEQSNNIKEQTEKGGETQSEAESSLRRGDYRRRVAGESRNRANENGMAITASEGHFSEEESEPER